MEVVWDIPVAIDLFGYSARWYSIIYAATLVACWLMLIWQIERGGGTERDANWLTFWNIVAVFAGGRLGHLVFYEFDRLAADPTILWQFRDGGIASHGSTIGLLIGLTLFAKFKGIKVLEVHDRTAIPVALAAATVRIGNLFNSEVVGRLTDQTWGFRFPLYDRAAELAPLRHPSQLYEFVMGMAIFFVMLAVDRRMKEDRPLGLMTALFFALYFTSRFIVEFFKEYQTLPTEAPLTMGQLLSIPAAVAGWGLLVWSLKKQRPVGWTNSTAESG